MAEFDQALYDAVMDQYAFKSGLNVDAVTEVWKQGYHDAAYKAARISAERQATPTLSDEVDTLLHDIHSWLGKIDWGEWTLSDAEAAGFRQRIWAILEDEKTP